MPKRNMTEAERKAFSEKMKRSWAKRKRAAAAASAPGKSISSAGPATPRSKRRKRRKKAVATENGATVTITVKAGNLPTVLERLKVPKGQEIEIQI